MFIKVVISSRMAVVVVPSAALALTGWMLKPWQRSYDSVIKHEKPNSCSDMQQGRVVLPLPRPVLPPLWDYFPAPTSSRIPALIQRGWSVSSVLQRKCGTWCCQSSSSPLFCLFLGFLRELVRHCRRASCFFSSIPPKQILLLHGEAFASQAESRMSPEREGWRRAAA